MTPDDGRGDVGVDGQGGRRTDDRVLDRLESIAGQLQDVRLALSDLTHADSALRQSFGMLADEVTRVQTSLDVILAESIPLRVRQVEQATSALDGRVDALADLPGRVRTLEDWQTWAARAVLGFVIAAILAAVFVTGRA